MSSIDSAGAAAQQAIFDKLGIKTDKTVEERGSSDKLGQDDFLQLMTAQLQNQDPFAPMENGDFIAQMAQFSTVSGIEQINKNLEASAHRYCSYFVRTLGPGSRRISTTR